jgi:hypothetical protein
MNFSNKILAELANQEKELSIRDLMLHYNNSELYTIRLMVQYDEDNTLSIETCVLRNGLIEHIFTTYLTLLEWVQMQEGAL